MKRNDLKPRETICLCGESDGMIFKRTFTIVQKISEGAFSVCYEAYYQNSGRGVLKMFSPRETENFADAQKRYMEPYEMLLNAKQNSGNQDMATFIPAFEIYYGCDEAGSMTDAAYVWTPEPKLETFDKICEEIHRRPQADPEHKLFTVLAAMESLTKCICALHSADMIHRDIKPSNFGFVKRGNETLTQALSMFDINSVCSVYGENDGVLGTEGYMEPEAGYEAADNQTDIYSIGATLFHAIIVLDETENDGYLYRREYYDRLHRMVDESKLIQASEANAHPRLRNILTAILQKCLCERTYRYANCEELLADIEKALYYVLPSDIARKSISGERWILADVEKSLDVNREKNSSLAMQYHLYEHPLYRCLPKGEATLNVLVVGFGNYGQKFLDACLQAGQLRGKKLNVTVVSEDATDKEIYLSDRPELAEFFNIDGSLADSEDTYGDIIFQITKLERSNQDVNVGILEELMCEQHGETKSPHYIFIALGEDSLNLNAAGACKTALEVLEISCVVSYVREGQKSPKDDASGLCPLYVNANIQQSDLYPEIERMAFNTHLIWEKNLNVDYGRIRAEFRKTYNHDACVSNVLSLKYKLFSMGIDLEKTGFSDAAALFDKMIVDKRTPNVRNELIWVEHRRWVTEKLCLGWRRIRDMESCAGGMTKDVKNKRHVCILRSRPDQKLAAYTNDKWDNASEKELGELDELDRMSVELHRMFEKKADAARRQNLLSGNNIAAIRTLIEGDKKAVVAFQEWFTCLKDIWNRDMEKVRLYKGLKNSFLAAADKLPGERRKAVRDQVKAFEAVFYPLPASMEYRDWKQDDVTLVDNIPFVLTYTENAYMVIPYAVDTNTEVFGNVAAPTVVNPAKILYLYLIEKEQDVQELLKTIPYVMEYMKKKKLKAAVEFILLYHNIYLANASEELEKEIQGLGGGRIRQTKSIKPEGTEAMVADLELYLKKRSAQKSFFAVEKNDTRLSSMLQGAGFYGVFPGYRFYSDNMRFAEQSGCDMLSYIKKMPYITVTDMVAFRISSSESSNQPEFFDDYKELWKTYCDKSSLWKILCTILNQYAEENDVLVSFKKKPGDKTRYPQKYRYILPFVCKKSIEKIIRFLKEQDIVEEGSSVKGYTTESCEVVIVDCYGYREQYDRLFAQIYALMISDAITLYPNTKTHEVNVRFDNLMVRGVSIVGNKMDELMGLMEYFKEKGYMINLTVTRDGRVSFTYATRQIKELLTTAGKILEIYTYHKIKECGHFDDIVNSLEIDWEETGIKNEFDCILTKGFRTLFVECKARPDIDQSFYYKMSRLVEQFGINATAVLIADTQEKSYYDNAPINALQRKRGSMLNVVTIWKKIEIGNIGNTLMCVINGRYKSEEE